MLTTCVILIWTTSVIQLVDMTINIKADISNAEFEVLDVLWDDYPATSSNLVERLSERKDWHHKTVKTLLSRLVKKQIVSYEQDGRQYRYFPLIAREEYTQKETKSFINRLFDGKIAPLLAGFSSQNSLSKDEIKELKELIKKWEQDSD